MSKAKIEIHGTSAKNYSETTGNPPELPNLFKIAHKYGAATLTLLHLLPIGGAAKEKHLLHFRKSVKRKILNIIAAAKRKYRDMYIDYKKDSLSS